MRLNYGVYISLAVALSGVLASGGCDRRQAKRTYHEIVQSAPQQPPPAPMTPAFPLRQRSEASGEARPPEARFAKGDQGRPMSGELDASSIPNDDVHAFLRNGQAAFGEPRQGRGSSAIPDDDIHASLGEGQGVASGAMPAFGEARQGRPMTGVVDQQTQKMLEASVARPPLSWATPEGWQDQGAGGMRLATFKSADAKEPVECALISLAGAAGGLESNAARWMRQVNIAVPEAPDMEEFLAAQKRIQTKDGFDATILDLTQLQPKEDFESPSMVATVITLPDMTVFVKMTGTRGAILENKDKFETLCASLKLN
ncbi:MAG: hypothetical protein AAB294_04860 [Pseudomonadota bacterium]